MLIGDGGVGIGATHWLNATGAASDTMTVLVMNNFFGMTGACRSTA